MEIRLPVNSDCSIKTDNDWANIKMDRTQELIGEIVSHPETSETDGRTYELLKEYYRGGPTESLRILLSSDDDRVAGEAAWIASELGESGKPLLSDIGGLLKHRSKKVRFWSIDYILLCATAANGRELASTVVLVDDPEEAVRWKVMGFLAMASREQLQAALTYSETSESAHAKELNWLLSPQGADPILIIEELHNNDARRRKFAVAAAYRVAEQDRSPLNDAAASIDDLDVAQFARDMLKRLG